MLNEFILISLVCLHRNKRTNLIIDLFHHHYGVVGNPVLFFRLHPFAPSRPSAEVYPLRDWLTGISPGQGTLQICPRTAKENLANSSLCHLSSQESSNSIQPSLLDRAFIDLFFLSTFFFRETLYTIFHNGQGQLRSW
jgi:hypothetical protein